MGHVTARIGPMPVRRAGWTPHHIPDGQALGLSAAITDPAGPGQHAEHLAAFVGVPVCFCAGGEGDVAEGDAVVVEDFVDPDVAGEPANETGIGNMGFHMAGNIRRAIPSSTTLVINDMNHAACKRFLTEFAHLGPIQIAATAKEAATLGKTVLVMVPTGTHSRAVFLDSPDSIIHAPTDEHRLILECSTIDMKTCTEIGQKIMAAGVGRYIDAPVSGGVVGAAKAKLSFMAGCPSPDATESIESLESRAHRIMSMMGDPTKIFYTDKLGTGLAAKIANNYIACCTTLATAEAMAIGVRSGIDPAALFRIIKASSGSSWHLDFNPCMPGMVPTAPSSNGFAPSFKPFLAVKDLSLGIEAGADTGVEPRCAEAACRTFREAAENPEYKDLDFTSVWLLINREK
ncbi:hypothetical protein FE257_004901 [Aspergillus nanangensis]|uniref:3-hydroxyisobutyrate dehydrogenase n=1 Tax=Aspergillus nanangensis TaxID=2582783 RepID=A0AAD4CAL5_ASPNN|nr:hypothetical protein FE257_004901 [Aspergillus nanangensis]